MHYLLILLTCLSLVCGNGIPKCPKDCLQIQDSTSVTADRAEVQAGVNAVAQIVSVKVPATGNTISATGSASDKLANISPETIEAPVNSLFQKADHGAWNSLLQRFVDAQGNVDYNAFAGTSGELDQYLDNLSGKEPTESAMKNERLAYYINLYNAATVKLILDNYPVKSIKDIKSPWGTKWIKIGDRKVSLGDIEHKILRKMGEPRIHFAINCASFSCPKLVNRAFTASQMEIQLQKATLGFIRDTSRNQISKSSLQLSNIFNWYKKDFTESGTLIEYLDKFTEEPISSDATIKYLEYDWGLNEAK